MSTYTPLSSFLSRQSVRWRSSARALIGSMLVFAAAAPLLIAPAAPAEAQLTMAPEFPANAAWLNTAQPLSLRALRGKLVLLDFWTYGCINCMQILPDLKRLERKYPNELVIISVHTAKFTNEDETQNIRNAVLRYNIEHPILNDAGRKYWNALGVQIWPTQVLIDPSGNLVGAVAGEGHYDEVDRAIAATIRSARAAGKLDSRPIKFALEAARKPKSQLSFPGKVLADTGPGGSGRLYIADSHHNRIVISSPSGEVEAVAGTGEIGRRDGGFHEATFSNPQGLAVRKMPDGSFNLLVADTNNHTIRSLDLKRGTVTTIAGTGKQAPVTHRVPGGVGTKAALASPWDLLINGKMLYIAMAGPHQIWSMNLETGLLMAYAGSGKEARTDGGLRTSAFAQPSGLSTDGKRIFVADSEISAIRAVDLPSNGTRVTTLAGGDLFDFGDRDGPGFQARLQHPLGVAYGGEWLYIADTYNHKIKRLNLASSVVETFLGGQQFLEPGGISLAGDLLYVADTNNHRVCVVDVNKRTINPITFKHLPAPLPGEPERSTVPVDPDAGAITLPLATLAPQGTGALVVDITLPAKHKLAVETPHRLQASVRGAGVTLSKATLRGTEVTLPLRIPLTTGAAESKGTVAVNLTLFYCSEDQKACKLKTLRLRAPYEVKDGGSKDLTIKSSL
ncbi:MAG: thioredoxin-like domain-containing protein [Actinomycetota bacterium]